LASSVSFTPIKGFELENPELVRAQKEQTKSLNSGYFSGVFKAPTPVFKAPATVVKAPATVFKAPAPKAP
jgi:hypothetical protein